MIDRLMNLDRRVIFIFVFLGVTIPLLTDFHFPIKATPTVTAVYDEIERVVKFLKEHGEPDYNYQVTEDSRTGGTVFDAKDADDLLEEAIQIVIDSGKASTSFLQRRLKIGYSRAARIVDMMEDLGIIGAQDGAKARKVLVDQWPPQEELEEPEELSGGAGPGSAGEEDEDYEEEYDEEVEEDEGYQDEDGEGEDEEEPEEDEEWEDGEYEDEDEDQ